MNTYNNYFEDNYSNLGGGLALYGFNRVKMSYDYYFKNRAFEEGAGLNLIDQANEEGTIVLEYIRLVEN